ncbi:acyltransferase family protein [Halomonas stenophila]|uniref:Peptidoglycan/LPS O-acetylase OafA/YrhL n=1 Tax=Halomonas stenophila TaxID=795312 RepID=A0A7W5EQE7_9GAMM|nr:acyltransferase family protein [Halomonas stenophila]MBB3229532.1 peptidoglycan/LPS O-acetylase OafA/YrhL [Halomonas stenophila]
MTTNYRPEVDGLRAVAVIPVILFHAGFEWVSGGYVGVDVFFVVSGYLITSIIYGEILKGNFSIVHFYERRARRILPALFFVTLVCLMVAWFWLLPEEFESLSESLIAVNLFVSNIYFWQSLDYFAGPAEMQPFLHTWSLAVEEQFYLFFPLFMLIVARFRHGVMLSIIALGLLGSLLLAEYGASHHPTANFYLLPTRAWELLAGGIIAIYMHDHRIARSWWVSRVGGSFGLALILYAAFAFDETTPFPSLWTVLPVLGASLVILFANGNDVAGRLLSWKPVVGIGLISYSAYLWHQPVFVFAKERSLGPISDGQLLLLSVFSILLAWLSWRFVEQPFRNRRNFTRAQIFKTALVTSCLMIGIGTYGLQAQGIPWRFGEEVERIVNVRMTNSQVPEECHATEGRFLRIDETCEYNENGEKIVVIWGDSHATPLVKPVADRVDTLGMRVKMLVYTNCLPIEGISRFDEPGCGRFNDQVMDYLIGNEDVDMVIMMARYPLQIEGEVFDNGEGGIEDGKIMKAIPMEQESDAYLDDDERIDIVGQRLESTVDRLVNDGKRVVLYYPVPEVGWDVPYLLAKERIYGIERQAPLSTNYERYKERVASSYRQFARVAPHRNILKMEPSALLCDTYLPGRCAAQIEDQIFYYDSNHLSVQGSSLLVDQMFRDMGHRGWMNEQQLKLTQLDE